MRFDYLYQPKQQSSPQSPRYPCPTERETRDSGIQCFREACHRPIIEYALWLFASTGQSEPKFEPAVALPSEPQGNSMSASYAN